MEKVLMGQYADDDDGYDDDDEKINSICKEFLEMDIFQKKKMNIKRFTRKKN